MVIPGGPKSSARVTASSPTEGPIIVQRIADMAAGKNLAPARDLAERYKLIEWLNYITTELHKNIGPMCSPVLAEGRRQGVLQGPRGGAAEGARKG